jgi:hypothetical protein
MAKSASHDAKSPAPAIHSAESRSGGESMWIPDCSCSAAALKLQPPQRCGATVGQLRGARQRYCTDIRAIADVRAIADIRAIASAIRYPPRIADLPKPV